MQLQRNVRWLVLVASFLLPLGSMAQTVYTIPFASSGNAIELTVANISFIPLSAVKVEAKNAPSWIRFVSSEHLLQQVEAKGEAQALFSFSVEKNAPVNEKHKLLFTITTQSGETWTKEITISINPPDHFNLFQNYPNPFNPTTTISYELPAASHIVLKIYNVLGQEVATLVNADRPAGHHQEIWNAANQASGMYVYQLTYTDQHSKQQIKRKPMMLVK